MHRKQRMPRVAVAVMTRRTLNLALCEASDRSDVSLRRFRALFQLQRSAYHTERRSRGAQCLLRTVRRRFVLFIQTVSASDCNSRDSVFGIRLTDWSLFGIPIVALPDLSHVGLCESARGLLEDTGRVCD